MALTCEARHSFAYTGWLTGGQTLKRRSISARLSDGRAWGAAVATWHAAETPYKVAEGLPSRWDDPLAAFAAHAALRASYATDIAEQAARGVFVSADFQVDRESRLASILTHYMATAERLPNLTRIEDEFDVPILSRTGRRVSTRYHFGGFLDGFTVDENGHDWIFESKLRDSLTPIGQIQLSRQLRWYAWAHQRVTDAPVVGALVDERLNDPPKPPRLVKARKGGGFTPSHAKDQLCTAADYVALCEEFDVDPHDDVIEALNARDWQHRYPIPFRPSELEEAGRELVSAAKLIRDLDSGERYPVRNAQPYLCRGCQFFEACPNPDDDLYLETLYEFREPKRVRELVG